jgi:putative peptidoglycan lipid II flippase
VLSGVLGYIVIPEYFRRRAADDERAAELLLRAAIWQVLLYTTGLALLTIALAGPLTSLIAPGLDSGQHDSAVEMLRIASPAMVFYGLTGLAGAVLNTRDRFLPIPVSFVLGNAAGILVLIALSSHGIIAAALGYVAAAAASAVYQWAVVHRQEPLVAGRPVWRGPEVSTLVKGGVVAILVISAPFTRVFFERILASTASTGDLAALGFATRLILTIAGVVAVSVGTVIFPRMTEQELSGDRVGFVRTVRRALVLVIAISLPISIVMIAAPSAVVSALFEHGKFSSSDTEVTSAIVQAFAVGVVAICVTEILLRALFAIGAERRAFVAIYANLALNLALDIWLIDAVGVEGLGIGLSIALWINVAVLAAVTARALRSPPSQARLS